MNVWHISDTHGLHEHLQVPEDVALVIHSGDATNSKDPQSNYQEMQRFIDWFAGLPVPHKVFIPGNHETSLGAGVFRRSRFQKAGITLIIDTEVTIEGLRVWGSPWTPQYGEGWAFMADRGAFQKRWARIPEGLDVLVTHGPPFGILDATYTKTGGTALVGCRALQKRLRAMQVPPKVHLFGHVHNTKDILNTGERVVAGLNTHFFNSACCEDGEWNRIVLNGTCVRIPQ